MNFYSFDEIKQRANCVTFVESVLGAQLNRDGRCAAVWRGGDGMNVSVEREKWYDHKAKTGGGIIELCATAKFNGDIQQAQNFLGEWLRLEPKNKVRKSLPVHSRYDDLIAEGYKDVKRYGYHDLDGNLVHLVARLEHPEKKKEFIQGTPDGWGLRGVTPILYRLSDWINSTFVCIVEGEKDADTLNDLGIPATTNCGGADKWRPEYAEKFQGKNVVIIRDNDESGEKHADRVARELKDSAKRIVVICPSKLPKGDVTDWIQKEGGTTEKLIEIIQRAPALNLAELEGIDPLVTAAKEANRFDFSNFTESKEQIGAQTKTVRHPRQINAIIEDIHKRFMGFPRRVGGSKFMFDHDRESHKIVHIHAADELFAWIGRKSKRKVAWAIGDAMVTKAEIFKGLAAEAHTYEAVSNVPDWPRRDDVYYAHPPLPDPSPGFHYFHDLVEFFNPASDAYRTMLKAFICAPLWYINGIPRPGWIIDSEDGAGTGKTTLVELVAKLYMGSPIRTNKQELKTNVTEIIKRLVSTEGRLSRILLADNITGDFHCAELSDFMTAESISGKAPYGRGEEIRPNNLTYVITANSATVDNDLSDRCFFIKVCKPKRSGNWKREVLEYIEKYRYNIIADIMGMLQERKSEPLEMDLTTRFPEFEETILWGVCGDLEEYSEAIAALAESRSSSNIEDEHAKTIEDEFMARLIDCGRQPGQEYIFIRSDVAKLWVDEIIGQEKSGSSMQYLRNLAKNGLTERFDTKPERYPSHGPLRRRGIMWRPEKHNGSSVRIIGVKNRKVVEIV